MSANGDSHESHGPKGGPAARPSFDEALAAMTPTTADRIDNLAIFTVQQIHGLLDLLGSRIAALLDLFGPQIVALERRTAALESELASLKAQGRGARQGNGAKPNGGGDGDEGEFK